MKYISEWCCFIDTKTVIKETIFYSDFFLDTILDRVYIIYYRYKFF